MIFPPHLVETVTDSGDTDCPDEYEVIHFDSEESGGTCMRCYYPSDDEDGD